MNNSSSMIEDTREPQEAEGVDYNAEPPPGPRSRIKIRRARERADAEPSPEPADGMTGGDVYAADRAELAEETERGEQEVAEIYAQAETSPEAAVADFLDGKAPEPLSPSARAREAAEAWKDEPAPAPLTIREQVEKSRAELDGKAPGPVLQYDAAELIGDSPEAGQGRLAAHLGRPDAYRVPFPPERISAGVLPGQGPGKEGRRLAVLAAIAQADANIALYEERARFFELRAAAWAAGNTWGGYTPQGTPEENAEKLERTRTARAELEAELMAIEAARDANLARQAERAKDLRKEIEAARLEVSELEKIAAGEAGRALGRLLGEPPGVAELGRARERLAVLEAEGSGMLEATRAASRLEVKADGPAAWGPGERLSASSGDGRGYRSYEQGAADREAQAKKAALEAEKERAREKNRAARAALVSALGDLNERLNELAELGRVRSLHAMRAEYDRTRERISPEAGEKLRRDALATVAAYEELAAYGRDLQKRIDALAEPAI